MERSRIEMLPRLDQPGFFRELAALDVVLDTHPFSGGTSTLDALWHGVPVVTLAGALSHSRSTASILAQIGRGEWVAETPERYLEAAASLALLLPRDPGEREALRRLLRDSPLCDGPGFARAMEAAFRQAWSEVGARPAQRPRDAVTAFWRGLRAGQPAPALPRTDLAAIATIVDCARDNAAESIARAGREWVLFTDTALFPADFSRATLPTALMEKFDVLASLGADALAGGDIAAAGKGHVRGVLLVGDADAGRVFASAWVPGDFGRWWRCLAVRCWCGGNCWAPASHRRDDARIRSISAARSCGCPIACTAQAPTLGVSVALTAADRSWMVDSKIRNAALRSIETDLGLPRWGQSQPGAPPMKAAFPALAWAGVLPALERLIDG